MKNSWLKKSILILLLLDAIIGTLFGVYTHLSNDIVFFEKYYLIIFYAIIFDVIAPIYLFVKLVIFVCKTRKAKKLAIAEEKARLEEERKKEIERKKAIEDENKRISKVQNEIDIIIKNYKLDTLPVKPKSKNINTYTNIENSQAVETVKKFKSDQIRDINECSDIATQINRILYTHKKPDEKLSFLQSNKNTLISLKTKYDALLSKINSRKIDIATKTKDNSVVKTLLHKISLSEKCISNSVKITDLLSNQKPYEFGIFNSPVEPIILVHNNLSYCIFDNIILVFDNDGIFLTAVRPSSLLLNFTKHISYVDVTNHRMEENYIIGKDSRLLEMGKSNVTWMYMRKDGMPDKRYTYNPRYEHRRDKYEYGEVSFKLLDTLFDYQFSSASALNVALELSYKYNAEQYNNSELCKITFKNIK